MKTNSNNAKNTVIQQLTERKSVRVFEDRPITDEEKRIILQAAMEAPTAGNQQLYTILDITDQEIKKMCIRDRYSATVSNSDTSCANSSSSSGTSFALISCTFTLNTAALPARSGAWSVSYTHLDSSFINYAVGISRISSINSHISSLSLIHI